MASNPERRPSGIKETKEEFDIPENLEDTGIKKVEEAFTATVKDGKKPLIQSPSIAQVSVKIPKTQQVLEEQEKGDIKNASTGFAKFWLRMIKKAIYLGKKIVVGEKQE